MSDEPEAAWSSGLSRSYSAHAALVLQHYQQHRRRLPSLETATNLKCTYSGPEFHRDSAEPAHSDEEDDDHGRRTWRISSSASDEEKQQQAGYRRRNIIETGCGDSSALSTEFSELNLSHHQQQTPPKCLYGGVITAESETSTSQNTRSLSVDRRCRLFDEDDDDDENFALIDLDDEEYSCDDDYREQSRQAEDECTRIYAVNDGVVSTSCTSLNTVTSHQRLNGKALNRQMSYENWARDKQRELQRRKDEERRAEQKRREIEEHEQREREEKERRDYDCYLEWLERKKREKQLKRELMEKELDLQKRLQDVEDKAKLAKNICLRQWQRKKEEQKKALEREELMKKRKSEEEKQRRLQESLKAYEKWREKAKNTPRPATQGLLPHQKAKPTFTNPTPWQPLVNLDSDESDSGNQMAVPNMAIKNQRNKKVSTKR